MKQNLTILAIETSCDDTCVAVLKIENCKLKILSNVVSSQVKLHQKYGGVYPSLAKREHQRNLIPVLKKALKESNFLKSKIKNQKSKLQIKNKKLKEILSREKLLYQELEKFHRKYQKPKIDAIAVTVGPGLEPCLWVGVNFAKALGYFWNLPIVPVNHIEAHILVNFLPKINEIFNFQFSIFKKNVFPAICLVVSGGHTQLILMKNFRNYKILGETRDDAAGECFDKTARILGLSYPGGPQISALAAEISRTNADQTQTGAEIPRKWEIKETRSPKVLGERVSFKLPRPMINSKDYDFSFSGLKTAVLYKNKELRIKNKEYIRVMAKEIQQAIIDVLIKKTIKAAKNYKVPKSRDGTGIPAKGLGIKTIILGGGVVANDELRRQFNLNLKSEILNLKLLVPPKNFCTDNAAMVGITGYFHWLKGKKKNWQNIEANANLRLK